MTEAEKRNITVAVCQELFDFNEWLHKNHSGKAWRVVLRRPGMFYQDFLHERERADAASATAPGPD